MTKIILQISFVQKRKQMMWFNLMLILVIILTVFVLIFYIKQYKSQLERLQQYQHKISQIKPVDTLEQMKQNDLLNVKVLDQLMQARTAKMNYNHIQISKESLLNVEGSSKEPTDVNLVLSNAASHQLKLEIKQIQMDVDKNIHFELTQVLE